MLLGILIIYLIFNILFNEICYFISLYMSTHSNINISSLKQYLFTGSIIWLNLIFSLLFDRSIFIYLLLFIFIYLYFLSYWKQFLFFSLCDLFYPEILLIGLQKLNLLFTFFLRVKSIIISLIQLVRLILI